MKLPFLAPVVPPHVFCLLEDGVTYARVRRDPAGFEEARHFRYPANSVGRETPEAPVLTREAIAEAVKAARALSGGRLTRASVLFPDAWARVLAIELEAPITADKAGTDMLLWKLKKLLPPSTGELVLLHNAMPALDGENRVLVVATPRATVDAIERAFEEAGVRIGYLAPSSVALFQGLAPTLAEAASGDYAVLHRTERALSFLIGRGAQAIFFRQRPPEEDEDHDREARLSLSYYVERLKGPGLAAVYVHDERAGGTLENLSSFPVRPVRIDGRLFDADPGFDEKIAARPELLAGFAAVYGYGRS
ncbi:MAG TPA: hypothetical protein VGK26_00335 [Thermoanaerobaculia bacterium]